MNIWGYKFNTLYFQGQKLKKFGNHWTHLFLNHLYMVEEVYLVDPGNKT